MRVGSRMMSPRSAVTKRTKLEIGKSRLTRLA